MRHFPTEDRGSNNPLILRTATLRMSLVYVDCGVSGKKFLWKAIAFERKSIQIGLVKNGGCFVQFMKDFFFSLILNQCQWFMWIVVWSYYNSDEKVRNNILYMALAFERESTTGWYKMADVTSNL